MSTTLPRSLLRRYEEAAEAYLQSLPLEHFMEATAQGKQREITLASLALVHARRPEVQVFNELLVQYPYGPQQRIRQVVPDNMVVVWDDLIEADGSFDLPFQPAGPFWVLEYVSKYNKRKDYVDNRNRYERELKVPYYLVFYPDGQELILYRHTGKKLVAAKPNAQGRLAIAELELEVALHDGWVRFWRRGRLLQLPADFQNELEETREQLIAERKRANTAVRRADTASRRAESASRRAEAETRRAEVETQRAVAEARRAEAEARRAETAERELAKLKTQLEHMKAQQKNGR